MRVRSKARLLAVVSALLVVAASCNGESSKTSNELKVPSLNAPRQLGASEGAVNLVAWPGYVENGSTDPKADWVTPFQKKTGCKVSVKTATSPDEMLSLMKTGQYDAVSAPGDITLRLMGDGLVAPMNPALLPNYADVSDKLKMQRWNSVGGVAYGVPHGRGANLLMWRTDVVKTAPDSWSAVFDENTPYKGKVTAYDSPIYLADAALYLMQSKPELGIKDPYALDDKQFDAVVDLLKKQKSNIGQYWTDYASEVQSFKSGAAVIGPTWQSIANLARTENAPVQVTMPKEGATGWSDSWMVAARAKHRNCAYRWIDHIISPDVNAKVSEWFGQAPANRKSCDLTADKDFCTTFHASDEPYFSRVWYRRTPVRECLDGRDVRCKDYQEWAKAWSEIKG
jgi:putative spermidine/putrescine transport system substrate-binding protein